MKLRELMTRDPRTCRPDAPVSEVARLMAELNVGCVPITDGRRLVGVITDRDIVLRAVTKGDCQMKASDCMTRDVVTATPEMDAHAAARLMGDHQVRRLPVVENGELVGIVALGDLATVSIHENEAGEALAGISEPSRPHAH